MELRIHPGFLTLFLLIQALCIQHTQAADKLGARVKTTSHFGIPSLGRLGLWSNRGSLNIVTSMPADSLNRRDPIWPTPGQENRKLFLARTLRGFPVRLKDTVDIGSVLAFDIDDDGQSEIVVGTRSKLHALELDGYAVRGFPFVWEQGIRLSTPLSSGHWGSEKKPTVFFGTEDGRLVALKGDGSSWEGFPMILTSPVMAAPTLLDVDGDRRKEIVFGTKDGRIHVVQEGGSELAGYPVQLSAPVTTVVTRGRFSPKSPNVLLFGDAHGNLHAWLRPGQELSGFPYKARFSISGQPVLGDINDDGRFEVIFGSKDYRIYAVCEDGSAVKGFPVTTGYRIYSTCALADIDGDGVTDIVATSGDGKVYAIADQGRVLPGFPVNAGRRLIASPVVGDVDGDGWVEIAVGTDQNRLVIYRHDGTVYPGFPVAMEDRIEVAPMLADLNGDGLVELIGVSRNGMLSAIRMIRKGKTRKELAWPLEGRDATRRGATYPNPPRYVELSLSPEAPDTKDAIRLHYRFFDLDGEPEPRTLIKWFRNNKHVPEMNGKRQLDASETHKHEFWHFTLQADPRGSVFKSPLVNVVNTPPETPKVSLLPEQPKTRNDLTMKIVQESKDVDGDKVNYNIVWIKDRDPQKNLAGPVVSSKHTTAGQRWTVVVTPHDGEIAGQPARTSLTIANTAPLAAKIRLDPPRPTVTQDVRVVIERAAEDADGDQVSYRYRWEVDGKFLNLGRNVSVVSKGLVAKHSKLGVEITSFDGQQEGGKTKEIAEIFNTPPSAPSINIVPASPCTKDDLAIEIEKPASDPDRDVIDYQVRWEHLASTGKKPAVDGLRLPWSQTRKGETWMAVVTPLDGESEGKQGSAQVVIGNTVPRSPSVSAAAPRPSTTEDLVFKVVTPAKDADGDQVSLEVVWYEEGKEIIRGDRLFRFPWAKTRKNRRYMAKVISFDGTDRGPEVVQWFEVQNTAPSSCRVAIKPKQPGSSDRLHAVVTQASSDADGDRIQMGYRWYCNDDRVEAAKQPMWIEADRVNRGQRWTLVVTPYDGEVYGPACEASVVIKNRPPSAPVIALDPPEPTTLDALVCKTLKPSVDPDGDTIVLRYTWALNGRPFPASYATRRMPEGLLKKDQRWEVTVTVSDGELWSKPVKKNITVINSPPGAPQVTIEPASPLSNQDLYCRLSGPTIDPDGDPVKHTYAWYLVKGSKELPSGRPVHLGAILPAEKTRKGQSWACKATAHDGSTQGSGTIARVRVINSPPSAPRVEIRPDRERGLHCVVTQPGVDPDGDRVEYHFCWYKDGVAQSFSPQTSRVPDRLTRKDDIWRCAVLTTDGRLESAQAETRDIVVGRR